MPNFNLLGVRMRAATDLHPLIRWDDVRYFLEVAQTGSFNSAAKNLGVNQTTVGRRIRALESRLGADLFDIRENRTALTPDGRNALEEATRMAEIANSFARKLRGSNGRLVGEIRLNLTEGLATFWLWPRLQPFLEQHSALSINWFLSENSMDLGRDVDMAIWWHKPKDPHAVTRRLGLCGFSIYASESYAKKHGLPKSREDLRNHHLLQFNRYERNPGLEPWNELMREFPPAVRLENSAFANTVFKSGKALSLLPDYAVHVDSSVIKAPFDLGINLEVWLAYHEDRRKSARVRALATEICRLFESDRGTWFS